MRRGNVCPLVHTFDDCSNLVSRDHLRRKNPVNHQIYFWTGRYFLDSPNALGDELRRWSDHEFASADDKAILGTGAYVVKGKARDER